jgi:hypothetical protein
MERPHSPLAERRVPVGIVLHGDNVAGGSAAVAIDLPEPISKQA